MKINWTHTDPALAPQLADWRAHALARIRADSLRVFEAELFAEERDASYYRWLALARYENIHRVMFYGAEPELPPTRALPSAAGVPVSGGRSVNAYGRRKGGR